MGHYLKIRRKLKRKKPEFLRTNWYRKKAFRNDPKWRWGHGRDNKFRLKMKGKPRPPEPGYRSPRKVRGLLPNGLKPVIIHNVEELTKIKEGEIAVIHHAVGKRKRQQILEKAKELSIPIANPVL